ncbi:MAG: PhzF family phenazine biosynthesis protein [Cyclobacteriaceae bacterium]
MKVPIYQVDAFTNQLFRGNPAAVCPLETWLPNDILQNIALENNLSETAFYVKTGDRYHLRWFTPWVEVDLCGHATLATAFVIFHLNENISDPIYFDTLSGELIVSKKDSYLTLDFPSDEMAEVSAPEELIGALNVTPSITFKGKTDYMLVVNSQREIEALSPDFGLLAKTPARAVIVTAPGEEVDFVSRVFAPNCGVNEDPVTGSAHTTLTPYWAKALGENDLRAKQLSARGGEIHCKYLGDRVALSGEAKLYLKGEIEI